MITLEKLWKIIDTAVELVKQILEEILKGGEKDEKK